MTINKEKQDQHFPLITFDNPLRRLFLPPRLLTRPYVKEGQTAADLGCGPGYYTLALAEYISPGGKVYAVDSDGKAVRALERKAAKRGLDNIETYAASAADLSFIPGGSVDFVLSHGLLCSMAPKDREEALSEMKRILKPDGLAYVSVARGPWSYVDDAAWEKILAGFSVTWRKRSILRTQQAAVVSLKKR
ncbi:MAG: class I SAM-dependent methyltransferase [Candidatus Aminicenantes bacterium]|nr:class I SAM-dependent methyltransferase [Candidatus Aminicenantes bacterium]